MAAACYDLLLLAGLLMATSYAVIISRGGDPVPAGHVLYRTFLLAQIAGFFIFFWWRGGQTLGMRAWHIRVETSDGRPLTVALACLRVVAATISIAALGLGVVWALVDPQGRCWHDRLTGTRVVRCGPGSGP